jgi:hypothetical protein
MSGRHAETDISLISLWKETAGEFCSKHELKIKKIQRDKRFLFLRKPRESTSHVTVFHAYGSVLLFASDVTYTETCSEWIIVHGSLQYGGIDPFHAVQSGLATY